MIQREFFFIEIRAGLGKTLKRISKPPLKTV
jgi:hypothetical protein